MRTVRLVFFGSGEFGEAALAALAARGHDIVLAVSQPDRPAGRGRGPRPTPIRRAAERLGVPVALPERPDAPEFVRQIGELSPDLAVVVAYGHLIRPPLLGLPRLGFVNLHASLLPAYRGAAPAPWAILRGETTSGVTVFALNEKFDHGAILARAELPIDPADTAETYLKKLAPLGAELLTAAVDDLAAGRAKPEAQNHSLASAAPKLRKEDGEIDWRLPFADIERRVRAFQPWPLASTALPGVKGPVRLAVIRLEAAEIPAGPRAPGEIVAADPGTGLVLMAGDRPVRLAEVRPEGRRTMRDSDFLRGTALARKERRAAGVNACAEPPSVLPSAGVVFGALERAGLTRKPAGFADELAAIGEDAVRRELARPARFEPRRLRVLLSPAARSFLEDMAREAQRLTRRRFGNAITLFAPLYVSNYCVNRCRYCGFNAGRPHRRRRLGLDEAMREAGILASEGFRDILVVSGEDRDHVGTEYLCRLAKRLLAAGAASVGIEVPTQPEEEYRRMAAAGIDGVTIFQETYNREAYAEWHPSGPKAAYAGRIAASEAAARAGMRRIGLGALLGLEDWRYEALAMAVHADALARAYWRVKTSFSFPRIRPSESGRETTAFPCLLSDADLTHMLLALRLCFPDSGMTLSTREGPALRDSLIPLGITHISAGSKTNPGGYGDSGDAPATEQFAVSDERGPAEMAGVLGKMGYDPVWKDWDAGFR